MRAAVLLVLLGLLAGCHQGPKRAQVFFEEGGRHYAAGDYDRAIAAYRRGLELEPRSAVGLNLVGMAYRMKYNTLRDLDWKEKELAAFREAAAADSTFWPAMINLGATLYYLDRKAEAAELFRKALRLNPENPEREVLEGMIAEGEEGR